MNRFAIIGNSHAGKFYTAFRDIKSGCGFSIDFYIERSKGSFPLRIVGAGGEYSFDDVLLMDATALSVEAYDAIIIVGLGIGLEQVILNYRDFRSTAHTDQAAEYLISESCFEASVNSVLESSKANRIIHVLQSMNARRIVVAPAPYPMEWVKGREGEEFKAMRAMSLSGDDRLLDELLLKYYERLGLEGVTVVPQPASTITGSFYTKTQFGIADPAQQNDPSSYYAKGDYKHGNVDYAHAHLEYIAEVLGATPISN